MLRPHLQGVSLICWLDGAELRLYVHRLATCDDMPALEPALGLSSDDTDDDMPELERIGGKHMHAMVRWSALGTIVRR